MKICIVGPALAPRLDGIGDYTTCLIKQLVKDGHQVSALIRTGKPVDPIEGVNISMPFSIENRASIKELSSAVEKISPDWVIVQYNPFCFGRMGLNLYMPGVLKRLKRYAHLSLMLHETYVPVINLKYAVMTMWQRWLLWMSCLEADQIFVSVEYWNHQLKGFPGVKRGVLLPVGSNISTVPITREIARSRLGISENTLVLGMFGTVHEALMLNRVQAAMEALLSRDRKALLLYIGPDGEKLRRELRDLPVLAEGPFEPEEVSRRLAAIDIYLAPFVDGISTRRSSMVTALQRSLPVVGTDGHKTDSYLKSMNNKSLLLSPVNDEQGFANLVVKLAEDENLRCSIAVAASQMYEDHFSWEKTSAKMIISLREAETGSE